MGYYTIIVLVGFFFLIFLLEISMQLPVNRFLLTALDVKRLFNGIFVASAPDDDQV